MTVEKTFKIRKFIEDDERDSLLAYCFSGEVDTWEVDASLRFADRGEYVYLDLSCGPEYQPSLETRLAQLDDLIESLSAFRAWLPEAVALQKELEEAERTKRGAEDEDD